jgi:hypothetical protein
METKTGFVVKGTLNLKVLRKDGSILQTELTNLITDWGLETMAAALAGSAINPAIAYLALGSGLTAAAESDTTLDTETDRALATVAHLTGSDNKKVEYNKAWAEGAITGTFKEAGMFDAASVGNMFNRIVFSEITVAVTDTFEVTWTIEFTNV